MQTSDIFRLQRLGIFISTKDFPSKMAGKIYGKAYRLSETELRVA